ncbi:ribosome maturation factor RimM [Labilibaculum antarcticum]|uniref:Ribosome maturation factor RimM n=1 Tax=Labilibaculum antarcticum TaxID=1717717 RepID=A0A1Y1CHB7_9BACT|nr:ribosome maturation factor RimM [Labilibaculum antarcticum]BAX79779.1 ribosome maturation factor RimM [Labilibaculum antarcticum]
MLKIEDCYLAGTFTKTHGVKGELVANKNSNLLEKNKLGSVLVDIDGGLVPFFIPKNGITLRNHSSVRIGIEDLDTEAKAKRFIGCDIYIPMKDVPEYVAEGDDLDPNVLIGFIYIDEEKGKLGEIEDIQDYSGNIVLVISVNDQEVLIPFAEENFIEIDEENKTITMQTSEGLIDMYLEEE